MYKYNGFKWADITANSDPRPAFIVSIQRRLAIAGMPGKRTVIDFSRVDDGDIFTADEDANSPSVLKAADIDVGNIIGTADEITGLGVFENSRLAVFTNDKTLVYEIHPDYTQWTDQRQSQRQRRLHQPQHNKDGWRRLNVLRTRRRTLIAAFRNKRRYALHCPDEQQD